MKEIDKKLLAAARSGKTEEVRLLLLNGADVNAKNSDDKNTPLDGRTSLHYAILGRHNDMIEVLIANGADVNAEDHSGERPIDLLAVMYYHFHKVTDH